jgi:drug/metabolite transporter (DMT)-like permease
MALEPNVNAVDRVIRVIVGAGLAAIPFVVPTNGEWVRELMEVVAGLIGLSLVVSGALAYCWIYNMLGINTCKYSGNV